MQVTRNGREYVVLLAAEDLASMAATPELLGDPVAQARVADSERDIGRGDVLDEAAVRAVVREASAERASGSSSPAPPPADSLNSFPSRPLQPAHGDDLDHVVDRPDDAARPWREGVCGPCAD